MRPLSLVFLSLWATLAAAAPPLAAQGITTLEGSGEPLEVTADQGIEWRRDEKAYIARGNAQAVRGELSVDADVLKARYRLGQGGKTEIWRLEAEGNVRLRSPTETATGEHGFYDLDQGVFVLRGDNLRLETEQDVITALDSLEYWEREQMAVARGDAQVVRGDQRLRADVLAAYFRPQDNGELALQRIDAFDDVRIATAQEFARGDRGVYYVKDELATLAGDVRITRGENQLNGAYAEVNLATGISRLLPAPPGDQPDQRVRGLLVPGSGNELDRGS